MKFGYKIWGTNRRQIKKARYLIKHGYYQYIELMINGNIDIETFKALPVFSIHAPHECDGFNPCNNKLFSDNILRLENSLEISNELNSKFVIVHPGYGNINHVIEFLQPFEGNKKILIKNLPYLGYNNEPLIGNNPQQIRLLTEGKFGFCFDISHGIKAAIYENKQWELMLDQFLAYFRPSIIHLCDNDYEIREGEHFDIGKGFFDFFVIMRKLKAYDREYITLETPSSKSYFSWGR